MTAEIKNSVEGLKGNVEGLSQKVGKGNNNVETGMAKNKEY